MEDFILATTLKTTWNKVRDYGQRNSEFLSQIEEDAIDAFIDETVEMIVRELRSLHKIPHKEAIKEKGERSDATNLLSYVKRLHSIPIDTISDHSSIKSYLREGLVSLIDSDKQLITLTSSDKVKRLKPTSSFNVINVAHETVQEGRVLETFAIEKVSTDGLAFERWEGAPFFPQVKKNVWYSDPNSRHSAHFELSKAQLATLLLDLRVQLKELVLNDDDGQFDMSVSVQLKDPVTIRWTDLNLDTQLKMLELTKPFLAKLYKQVITVRINRVKRDLVPQLRPNGVSLISSNLFVRLQHLEHQFSQSTPMHVKTIIATLYYTMLPPNSAQDEFLFDASQKIVELDRLLTNEEMLDLASRSKQHGRNRRIMNYDDEQFYINGEKDLANGSIRWSYDDSIQELARRYRDVYIQRLIKTHFARCNAVT
ncbi:hypothetical protein J6I92_08765 [Pseudidiomarina sp. 1APR75-15]|uniref:Nucleotidyltransferase n=1 Tax=Pseudidiomarina terrestris TaxID=2820060 RepID=A0ABT8MJ42_9GAMM|nr:hypothetical protein [Pseudidiomarina sp. 1APR75-15]MDN7129962.1 hypothetical protein [Pseudidiomarina sp. 1APR75-15]